MRFYLELFLGDLIQKEKENEERQKTLFSLKKLTFLRAFSVSKIDVPHSFVKHKLIN